MFEPFDFIAFLAAGLGGVLLGGMYFGGLWWTVSRLSRFRHPYLVYFASLVCRMLVLLVGLLWIITQLGLFESIGALAGLTLARVLLIRRFGAQADWAKQQPAATENASVKQEKSTR
jgi:F1F0 ATPase subunit 2